MTKTDEGIANLIKIVADLYKGFLDNNLHPEAAMELTKHFITTLVIQQQHEMSNMFSLPINNA